MYISGLSLRLQTLGKCKGNYYKVSLLHKLVKVVRYNV
jgi:hypothetical protein